MTRLIKKYSNRRLYDTESSSYISNEAICHLLEQGERIKIVSIQDGSDITRDVLLNIFAEKEAHSAQPVLSLNSLSLLATYDDALLTGVLSYFIEESLQWFMENQHLFRQQMENFDASSPHENIREALQKIKEALQQRV